MMFVVSMRPNPDSPIRLVGSAESLTGALVSLADSVDEYGSSEFVILLGRALGELQQVASEVQDVEPVEVVDGRLRRKKGPK